MKLFENYLNGLNAVINRKDNLSGINNISRVSDMLYKSNTALRESIAYKTISDKPLLGKFNDNSKVLLNFDKNQLEKYFGRNKASFTDITIGTHPDFKNLAFDQFEKHYCVSMFVDIKGSTKLSLKHPLEEVRLIKDSLLTLCIHVANFFGGHIHRLQGDAAFIQFVRRGLHPNDAIINALNAGTVLCQFVSNDLSTLFEDKDLNPIKIRVGIDYGSADQVLWSHYGIPGCNELTTTSLHTDLAAKLQAKAANNSIRIGKNLVTALDLPLEYFYTPTQKVDGKDVPDYYILQAPGFTYNQYVFDWEKYLNSFDFITKASNGSLEITPRTYELKCVLPEYMNGTNVQYYQNSFSIQKGYGIKYQLLKNGAPYQKISSEEIVWQAYNRGMEAKTANQETHDFAGVYKNLNHCDATAKFLGHHYLKCTIRRQFGDNVVVKFPIFVQ